MPSLTSTYRDIAARVVRSYRKNKRDLPWRRSKDAYRIWISEIMLQQTRVATVIPYYERWLQSFPTIDALATAELDDVLAHWSGLGYYSRARNIHKCAQELRQSYGGRLPDTARELRQLPGIGRYTAGAISSIAFDAREPLVDGNVARLLSRVFEIEDSIKSTPAIKRLWQICSEMVPEASPGDFNQGLMELGSLTCTAKNPSCEKCPLRNRCGAFLNGRTAELPIVPRRTADADKLLLATDAAFLIRHGKLLLAQRKPSGLFGGLWELPQTRTRAELGPLTGLRVEFSRRKPAMVHNQILTHRRLRIRVWPGTVQGRTRLSADTPYQSLAWHSFSSLSRLGISSATKAILQRKSEIEHGRSSK